MIALVRRMNDRYLISTIDFGKSMKLVFMVNSKFNTLRFSDMTPVLFILNERKDIGNFEDFGNHIGRVIHENQYAGNKQPAEIHKSLEETVFASKLNLLVLINKSTMFLKVLHNYIKAAAENLVDVNVKIKENHSLKSHNRNIISRKGCVVKGHFRHYKSGIITFVHPYARKGTNFEGSVIIEI